MELVIVILSRMAAMMMNCSLIKIIIIMKKYKTDIQNPRKYRILERKK